MTTLNDLKIKWINNYVPNESDYSEMFDTLFRIPSVGTSPSQIQNVNGSYVEVLKKRVRFTGVDLSGADGDNQRVLTLPDTNVLLESDGYILDIVVSGQPRFLTDDYTMIGTNQIRFEFPMNDDEVIHTTYKIEL